VARITLRQLLDHAAEHDYALPAFNINNMEQGLAIMEAAEAVNSPVIIQASRGARNYANDIMLARMIDALAEIYPNIPVCMHQDHGNGPATCATAIQYGFTSVMMDGSLMEDAKTPATYEYNVEVTRKVVEMAHSCGVSVEGELGVLGSLESGMGEAEDGHGFEGVLSHDELLTDPDQAVDFVEQHRRRRPGHRHGHQPRGLQVHAQAGRRRPGHERDRGDPPAPAQHPPGDARLQSSVPQDLQDIINQYGGAIPQTWGVPVEEIQRGIKHGVRKVNVDTDNRLAITGAIRKILMEKPHEFDPRAYLKPAKEAMRKVCQDRFVQFGSAGHADKIKALSTATMAKRYAPGELNAKFGATAKKAAAE
jgi:fructose-bisphosphate aldolase class II